MPRILVTEQIAPLGLDRLRDAGHEVDVQLDLTPLQLLDAVGGAHALVIRSATDVTSEVLTAGTELVVVGRAGIGLDNVDVDAATRRGVMVVNAPLSNTLSAAEHTMALLLAQARNVPQAHASLKQGRWERTDWTGVEIAEKTLGIVGLGRIGKLVAERALSFGMHLIGHDPFVTPERAQGLFLELMPLEEVIAKSDFLTLHVARTPETVGLIDAECLSRAKPALRVVNVARGGIVDEGALANAILEGRIAGAAFDVFETEPCVESPLFNLPEVVVTPHLGASTREAQDRAGVTVAEQVGLALAGDFVPFAVNVSASDATETVRSFLPLAEQLGLLLGHLCLSLPAELDIEFCGEIGGYDNKITEVSVIKGLLSTVTNDTVSLVNASDIAKEQDMCVRSVTTTASSDYVNVIKVRGGGHSVAGTLAGLKGELRIVMVDDHAVDLPPAEHMIVVSNNDQPGVIGRVGTVLGEAAVNISDMNVGRSPDGEGALMVISTGRSVDLPTVEKLRNADGVNEVFVIELEA